MGPKCFGIWGRFLIVVRVNALYSSCVHETVGEWMGPGGPHGLQLRWRASFGVRGGFDSLALPPVQHRRLQLIMQVALRFSCTTFATGLLPSAGNHASRNEANFMLAYCFGSSMCCAQDFGEKRGTETFLLGRFDQGFMW